MGLSQHTPRASRSAKQRKQGSRGGVVDHLALLHSTRQSLNILVDGAQNMKQKTTRDDGAGGETIAKRRDYMRVIAEACPPDVWAQIVQRAVDDALQGEPKARAWLTSILIDKQGKAGIDDFAVQNPAAYDEYESMSDGEKITYMLAGGKH